ncbi:uncharacterized protein LOC101772539 [Setaria italica]|uniref:uncharacterized protein LOC101772539 n=1 Tax=Setaria italica TaxID=4555 RepID=UPI00035128A6|nr:uncharacterized protein LOC101772539 [Setaria italica]
MAEAVISAVIGDMVSRAISFVIGHSTGQDSTSAKLQRIRHMLIKIGSVVEEAKGRQITNHGTLEWLSELVNGMYRGRYFLDISNESLSVGIKEFVMLLERFPPIFKPLRTNLYVDCEMFGRHIEREQVINLFLHKGNPSERKLDILPIIGNIGVGKKTLVQNVCDDKRVHCHFSSIFLYDFFFLTVMDNSEPRIVLGSRHSIGDFGNLNEPLQTFKHKLKYKRFLHVFENVDSEKKQMLQVLLSELGSCKQGSKIIVTSTHNHTASIGTVQRIKLRILPRELFWSYFKALALPDADFQESCPRMAAIGMAIAKKLDGSFFGAKITGALLKVHPNIQFCSEALRSSIWDIPVLGSSLPYVSDVTNYFPSKQKKKKNKKGDDKKKRKNYKKKRNGQAYYVEWDSDASSNSDDDDDEKPSKGIVSIAIKEAPSLFSTPFCLMAKGDTKVSRDDELELTYDDLVRMLNDTDDYMHKEKKVEGLEDEISISSRFL